METIKNRTEEVADHIGEYAESLFNLMSVSVIQKAVHTSSVLLSKLFILLMYIFGILFLGGGIAWWFGDILQSRIFGFLIVGGIFLMAAILLAVIQRKSLIPFFRNRIVRKIYE